MKMTGSGKKIDAEYEYIVVGTGPGGAPVALELAKAGKKVLILERGAYHKRLLGFPFGMRLSEKFFIFCRSLEGVVLERGLTVGGSSMIYNANVYDPTASLIEAMGIDFRPEAEEIKAEIGTHVLPERFFNHSGSNGGVRMQEAAEKMGIPFTPQQKFIDTEKCRPGCDWCMLGCPHNAKWTTREYIEEALTHGAHLAWSSPVQKVLFDESGKKAIGVMLKGGRRIMADKVILAAGGIGSPAILQRSDVEGVGQRFFMDPMVIIYGVNQHKRGGCWGETTFTHAIESFKDDGFIIGNNGAFGTWLVMSFIRLGVGVRNWHKLFSVRRGMGLFVKLAEDDRGTIFPNERVSKVITERDEKRMNKGVEIAKEIMLKAGAKPGSISELRWAGGHPGGTIAMGQFTDRGFATEFENLYVCDASVLPISPGVPPTLSILAMSRLLGRFLLAQASPEERKPERN
ncbi:MAG: GMC family oxidoreductase [Deltaproteobacteria bacterium]|nr:GMC family oxidoreductase [Deltaproteobacteria bacterium]